MVPWPVALSSGQKNNLKLKCRISLKHVQLCSCIFKMITSVITSSQEQCDMTGQRFMKGDKEHQKQGTASLWEASRLGFSSLGESQIWSHKLHMEDEQELSLLSRAERIKVSKEQCGVESGHAGGGCGAIGHKVSWMCKGKLNTTMGKKYIAGRQIHGRHLCFKSFLTLQMIGGCW